MTLLETIIDAPHIIDGWSRALGRLQAYVPCSSISVIIRSAPGIEEGYFQRFGTSFDEKAERAYAEHWHKHDYMASEVARARTGQILISSQLFSESFRARAPCYNEWAISAGCADAMISKVCELEGRSYWLAFNRDHKAPKFGADEAAGMRHLFPYLRNALIIEGHVETSRTGAGMLRHMLEGFDEAAFVTDQNGHVVMFNQRAQRLMEDGSLQLDVDRFEAATTPETEALRAWLSAPPALEAQWRLFQGIAGGPKLRFMKLSLPMTTSPGSASLVFVRPILARPSVLEEEDLSAVLGLSSVEAAVARRLAQSFTLETIAHEVGIKVGTVRNHLKRIYAKLGVNRQAELVVLVQGLTPRVKAGAVGDDDTLVGSPDGLAERELRSGD